MRATEILVEMPFLIAGNVDWGLQDKAINQREVVRVLASHPSVVQDDHDGILYLVGQTRGGQYAFVSKGTHEIEYLMQYETDVLPTLRDSATQIRLWNRGSPPGLSSRVFFDHMLHQFDTMVSDDQQTVGGQQFWFRQLLLASRRDLRIGLLDGNQINAYQPGTDFRAWLTAVDGWGRTDAHWDRRFYITNLAIKAS